VVVSDFQYLDHLGSWKEISCDRMTFEPSGHVAFWRDKGAGKMHLVMAVDREYILRINQLPAEF
jgi:hypothetical protein